VVVKGKGKRRRTRTYLRKPRDKSFVAVTEKLITILETLSRVGDGQLSLDDIAKDTALPKSTAHRLLNSLAGVGYVRQTSENGSYILADRFYELANSSLPNQRLISIARPLMNSLLQMFDESVNLGVYEEGMVTHIFALESARPYRVAATIGNRGYLHCTSMGKALGAFQSPEELERAFLKWGLPQHTRSTLTNIAEVLADFESIRATGVAHDNQEDVEGVECFGAPIFNAEGRVIASMSISGPSVRVTPQAEAIRNAVREFTLRISRVLGYMRPSNSSGTISDLIAQTAAKSQLDKH
jgi:IclR family transcriptional regulator, KDG regulon repressor